MPDERRIEIRGGAVTFKLLAGGSGAPLVYFHSYYERSAWSPFLDCLARSFSVYAPSHPGVAGPTRIETLHELLHLTPPHHQPLSPPPPERAPPGRPSLAGLAGPPLAPLFPPPAPGPTLVSPPR